MKAYGIPRHNDVEFPDIGDIKGFGLASHVGSVPKHGIHRGLHKDKAAKAATRRFYKRKARKEGKVLCTVGVAQYVVEEELRKVTGIHWWNL